MKKMSIVLLLFAVLLLVVCIICIGTNNLGAASPAVEPAVEEVSYPLPFYVTTDPTKMMDLAELVVVGTYLGDNPDGKPYPGGCSCPMASGLVEIEKVLRGRYENGVIPFYYYGGQLLIRDAIEYAEKEGLDRKKYRIFEWLEKDDPGANVIIKGRGSSFVEPEKGSRYLIYLFYEPNVRQAYCVMGDQYGFRSVNEKNQIYDPDTQEFMDWKALQE